MFSMIFIFVFDIASYLYRALSLNQRMESMMVSMQKIVTENNYLPKGSYDMYNSLFNQLMLDMNGSADPTSSSAFISGFEMNYNTDAVNVLGKLEADKRDISTTAVKKTNILRKKMSLPADYGDVMVVQCSVLINQPSWGFTGSNHSAENFNNSANSDKIKKKTTKFTYTYYVPCLKYQAITQ